MLGKRRFHALADTHAWIECGIRVLKHQLHDPAHTPKRLALHVQHIVLPDADLAFRCVGQPRNQPGNRAFAASGFTDETKHFPLADRQGNIVDGFHHTVTETRYGIIFAKVLRDHEWPLAVFRRWRGLCRRCR